MTFPCFGAFPDARGVNFRLLVGDVPTLDQRSVRLVVHSGRRAGEYDMPPAQDAVSQLRLNGAAPGDRYSYRLEDGALKPDPASRFQPSGVHEASEVIDATFEWHDASWHCPTPEDLVVYELHVGTFTEEGTFDAARRRLGDLRALGITAIELMPVADFGGSRNWGYDGVALFAPSRNYGRPDNLRTLVDEAHVLGLAVILDVVYNHLGPEGAYLPAFYPSYVTDRYETPWGRAINLDGPGSSTVRRFIIDNAVHWVREYHLDGLRLDATHALHDHSPVSLAAELAAQVRRAVPWPVLLHAEDHRNLASIVLPPDEDAWGFDGVWADDFHHILRRLVAGDTHGYYRDYQGTTTELAATLRQGWFYTGQQSVHRNRSRGTDASRVRMQRAIVCLQNHDQVGNRAAGERLHHQIDAATWRAASTVLLTAPMTPLIFMGQEWAASTPFLYFTNLEPWIGSSVTEGRRREFKDFPGFDPVRDVADPQERSTFERSQLRWEERTQPAHAGSLALYSSLLKLRAENPALQASADAAGEAWPAGEAALIMRRAKQFLIVALFRGAEDVHYGAYVPDGATPRLMLSSEDPRFALDPEPQEIGAARIGFKRAGAVVLQLA